MARFTNVVALACLVASTNAFTIARKGQMSMSMDRRSAIQKAIAGLSVPAAVLSSGTAANAVIDYANVAYLGGGNKVDINNANVRVYQKLKGMYPSAAGKIASHGPYKSVSEVYNIPGLTEAEKSAIKANEGKLVALDPTVEYSIDRINNGLYR